MNDAQPFQCFAGLVQGAVQSRNLNCSEADTERLFRLRAEYGTDIESLLDFLYDDCKRFRSVVTQYLERFGKGERALEERASCMLQAGKSGAYYAGCRFCGGGGCLACLGEAKRTLRERTAEIHL